MPSYSDGIVEISREMGVSDVCDDGKVIFIPASGHILLHLRSVVFLNF